jgi:hypothetical protein
MREYKSGFAGAVPLARQLAFGVLLLIAGCGGAGAASGTYLASSTLYPRLVRIEYGSPSANGEIIASTNGNIFESSDGGASFTYLDTVPAISGSSEYCCGTLFEMPQQVGSLQPGTLLYAATYFVGSLRAIEVYTSTDEGQTWSYSSTPVSGGDSSHGLWEPEFSIADDGALVMFWSDETDPCCSQKLAQIRTYDGVDWQNESNTVASTVQSDRPGMAVVTKLPSGVYFMSYELCGPAACTVFYRTSTDGWNYGDPSNTGTKVQTTSGQYFEHAPTNIWSPSVISPGNGALLLVGQVLYESSGAVSSENGQVLFVNNSSDGSGPWYTITAPVQVPTAYDNYCPNYSSALLPAADGSSILELASDYNSSNECVTYYGSEAWNRLPADGATYSFVNQQANLCLDDYGWGTSNDTIADLWNCSGLSVQQWVTHSEGNGWFSIQNLYSGLCVDNTGGSTSPGNKVTLWGCVGNENQSWLFMDLGNGQYKLMNKASGTLMLDDTGGSTTPGTQLQIWTDNGLPPQHWVLQ